MTDLNFTVRADTKQAEKSLRTLSTLGESFGRTMSRAFVDVAFMGQNLDDRLRKLALSLSDLAFKAATRPFEKALGNIFQSIGGGGDARVSFFARGGIPGRQMPSLFTDGGVISSPTAFGFNQGHLGVAGEAGSEAILPLTRGSDGRLGVRSAGGASAGHITINIATPMWKGSADPKLRLLREFKGCCPKVNAISDRMSRKAPRPCSPIQG